MAKPKKEPEMVDVSIKLTDTKPVHFPKDYNPYVGYELLIDKEQEMKPIFESEEECLVFLKSIWTRKEIDKI